MNCRPAPCQTPARKSVMIVGVAISEANPMGVCMALREDFSPCATRHRVMRTATGL
jgi:hypothetical protein